MWYNNIRRGSKTLIKSKGGEKMAVCGYARTSTFEQKYDDQIKELEEAGVDKSSVVIEPYKSRLDIEKRNGYPLL